MLFCHKQLLDLEALHFCFNVQLGSSMNMGPCPVHPHFLLENHCVCCGKPVSPDVTRSLYEMAALKWDLKVHILRGGAIKMGSLSAGSPALFGHSPHPLEKPQHYMHLEENIWPLDTFFIGREGNQDCLLSTWCLVTGRQMREMLSRARAALGYSYTR